MASSSARTQRLSDRDYARVQLAALRTLCRQDVNCFTETVFKNDQAAGSPPFEQQWFHREWQAAWCSKRIVVIHGATGIGKTEQIISHMLWRQGKKPSIRIILGGKTEDKGAEISAKMIRQIEENETLRWIFPELTKGTPWGSSSYRLGSAGIDTTTNTCTVYGIATPKAGPRADIVVLDDVNDLENTRTAERRSYVNSTVDSVLQTRLTTDGQLFINANAWHRDDLAFTYSRRPGVWHGKYPAIVDGKPIWPAFRPLSWLDRIKATMHPDEFTRMFLCEPRDESSRIFRSEWFTWARQAGAGVKPTFRLDHEVGRENEINNPLMLLSLHGALQRRMRVVVGVDLATGETERKRKTDFTVFFVLGIGMDGRRHVLWIERGRWDAGESIRRLRAIEERYRPEAFLVESNGTQRFFHQYVQHLNDFGATIVPFVTTAEKWDASTGIESIGIELQARRWVVPNPSPSQILTPQEAECMAAIAEWESAMLDFSRTGHTADTTMATWFAQKGALRLEAGTLRQGVFGAEFNPTGHAPSLDALLPNIPLDDAHETDAPAWLKARFGMQ